MLNSLKSLLPVSLKLRLLHAADFAKGWLKPVPYNPDTYSEHRILGSISRNNLINDLKATFAFFNLDRMALIYGTDKYGSHFYTPNYHTHLKKYRWKRINLFEIGVGGYKNRFMGGNSLRTWKKYFPFGKISAIDIYDKAPLQERRVRIFKGSQVDEPFLMDVMNTIGRPDVIIDDGSHVNEHVITSFQILFPILKDDGLYIIEDTQTSYWERFGGSMDKQNPQNMMNFFKGLVDGLNHVEFLSPGYQPSYTDLNIRSIHFYHNMVFIYKGKNQDPSNIVRNNSILDFN